MKRMLASKGVWFIGLLVLAVQPALAQPGSDDGGAERSGRGDWRSRGGWGRGEGEDRGRRGGGDDGEGGRGDWRRGGGGGSPFGGGGPFGGGPFGGGPFGGGGPGSGGPGGSPWGGGPGGWRGSRGGGGGSGDFFSRWDANKNGTLEPSEIPERGKPFIERAAQAAGLDPSKPIALDALRRRPNSAPAADTAKKTPAASTPLVPGFGNQPNLPAVPGFGIDQMVAANVTVSSSTATDTSSYASGSSSSSSSSSNPSPAPSSSNSSSFSSSSSNSSSSPSSSRPAGADEKIRKYAEGLLKQHDADKSGVLESNEWEKLRGDTKKADADNDGKITVDELFVKLGGGKASSSGSPSSGSSSSGGSSEASSGSASSGSSGTRGSAKPGRRFRTAAERLPEDIPSWFKRADRDEDGQVMMHEYSSSWSDSKVAEYERYDRNRDGVITPAEALTGER